MKMGVESSFEGRGSIGRVGWAFKSGWRCGQFVDIVDKTKLSWTGGYSYTAAAGTTLQAQGSRVKCRVGDIDLDKTKLNWTGGYSYTAAWFGPWSLLDRTGHTTRRGPQSRGQDFEPSWGYRRRLLEMFITFLDVEALDNASDAIGLMLHMYQMKSDLIPIPIPISVSSTLISSSPPLVSLSSTLALQHFPRPSPIAHHQLESRFRFRALKSKLKLDLHLKFTLNLNPRAAPRSQESRASLAGLEVEDVKSLKNLKKEEEEEDETASKQRDATRAIRTF
ncbi:hypothetical protein CVT26_001922 [Gymnopilus dilepis]|uniref:Uncharacterized protein n=1 Tax=Gymnopilus dilepis TaxID=231916 RepID=A0A409Y416_9AGAR|nr:hypothetical protein CVT26_001922 [Gymnopilus dilepis]